MLENAPQSAIDALSKQLEANKSPAPLFQAKPPVNTTVITDEQLPDELQEVLNEQNQEEEEIVSEQEDYTKAFSEDFKAVFGLEVEEARSLVDDLVAFRQETQLMRTWGVNPTEYDNRMGQVREFFNTLPEDKRGSFDNPEGAIAIWDYLQKNKPTTTNTATRRPRGNVRQTQNTTPVKPILKESELMKLTSAEYQKRYQEITRAYAEGRVVP